MSAETNTSAGTPASASLSKWTSTEVWLRGCAAASISGAANGVVTGMAAIGIDPRQFNLAAGFDHTLAIAGVSAALSAILGAALYLKQSPLPGPYRDDDIALLAEDPRRDFANHDSHDDLHDAAHDDAHADHKDDSGAYRPRP